MCWEREKLEPGNTAVWLGFSSENYRFAFLPLKVACQAFTWKISICSAKLITFFAARLAESSPRGELACGPLIEVLHRSCSWLNQKRSALPSAGFVRRLESKVGAEKFAWARNPTRYVWIMLNFCEFDMLRGETKECWTEPGRLSVALLNESGLAIKGLTTWKRVPCAFSLKDRVFGYFQRMKRKKISRVKEMAEIAAEIMVWEGYEVTGPIAQRLKSLLSMIQVSTGGRPQGQEQETNECEMGPFQQEIAERASTKPRAWLM